MEEEPEPLRWIYFMSGNNKLDPDAISEPEIIKYLRKKGKKYSWAKKLMYDCLSLRVGNFEYCREMINIFYEAGFPIVKIIRNMTITDYFNTLLSGMRNSHMFIDQHTRWLNYAKELERKKFLEEMDEKKIYINEITGLPQDLETTMRGYMALPTKREQRMYNIMDTTRLSKDLTKTLRSYVQNKSRKGKRKKSR